MTEPPVLAPSEPRHRTRAVTFHVGSLRVRVRPWVLAGFIFGLGFWAFVGWLIWG